jgi:[acyl-carrier-protein] S-malonyltransferase
VGFATPSIQVVHNVDVATHADPAGIRAALAQQLYGSVRWAESVSHMAGQGVGRFIECGPGRVLAGLNKRVAADAATETIFDNRSLAKAASLIQ